MFFENEDLSFTIQDVVDLRQKNVSLVMRERNFDAVSYRISSDAMLSTEKQSVLVTDGDVCLIPARLSYARKAKHDRLIAVHVSFENYATHKIEKFTACDREVFQALFTQILEIWNKKAPGYKYQCAALFNQILQQCYIENYQNRDTLGIIELGVQYIKNHYTDPELTVTKAADEAFISDVYFRKLFKKSFGVSPSKYIIQLRIQHAIGLIATGYYSLKEIAFLSGYTDYSYFCSEFKRLKGIPPSKYVYEF